jgi:hypothetical protein
MRRVALLTAAIVGLGFPAGLGLAVYLASGSSLAPPAATARVPTGTIAEPSTLPATTGETTTTEETTTQETTTQTTDTTEAPTTVSGSGYELNDEGYRLMQAGDYAAALPLLEQAVAELSGTGELYEAYALYNLAYTRFALDRCDGVLEMLDRSENIQGEREPINRLYAEAYDRCVGGGGGGGDGAASSFRIVPVPWAPTIVPFVAPERRTTNVSSASCVVSPATSTVIVFERSPAEKVREPACGV